MASTEKNAEAIAYAKTLTNTPWVRRLREDDLRNGVCTLSPPHQMSNNKERMDMIHLFPNYEQVDYAHENLSRNIMNIYDAVP
jgi:hypothetical protein